MNTITDLETHRHRISNLEHQIERLDRLPDSFFIYSLENFIARPRLFRNTSVEERRRYYIQKWFEECQKYHEVKKLESKFP
jgi:hypothetical protein